MTIANNCNIVDISTADQYAGKAEARLKGLGMKLTEQRKGVVRVLARTRKPQGAYQIREQVALAGAKIDVVSVYRILAALVEAGLAHRIGSVDGYLACSGAHTGEHGTQHLICTECGCVEEIPIPQTAMSEIGVAGSRLGFMGQVTRVETLGVCEHCR